MLFQDQVALDGPIVSPHRPEPCTFLARAGFRFRFLAVRTAPGVRQDPASPCPEYTPLSSVVPPEKTRYRTNLQGKGITLSSVTIRLEF